jgi:hypothetical protein
MANQTVIGRSTKPADRPNGVIQGVGSFGADLATLAVLQFRLVVSDFREGVKRATPALAALIIMAVVSVSGVVAIVIGASLWLASVLGLQPGTAMVLVGLACLIVAAAVTVFCIRGLASSVTVFRRSHEELERNLAWIKTTLTRSGR